MTDDQIDALTLGELRRIAARGLEVLADLQRLSAMMPGASPIQAPARIAPSEPLQAGMIWSGGIPQPQPRPPPGILSTNRGPVRFSPAEMAERQRLIQKNVDAGIPPDVAAAEAQSMPQQEE